MTFITKNNSIRLLFMFILSFCIYSCDPDEESFSLTIDFKHLVDDVEVVYGNDNLIYNNSSNIYSVRRLLYVLSDITLYFPDNTFLEIDDFIFINSDDSATLRHTLYDLPQQCSGIRFRLGFSSDDNIDNAYINSPYNFHSLMLWPNLFGTDGGTFQGGYHHLKLEGKFLVNSDESYFYNTHTGPINGFDYSILYPTFYFDSTSSISIYMDINKWYNNPFYDLTSFGNGIMDNLDAQELLYQNGLDIFNVQPNA
ncbi:MAG: hypothetical protein CMD26_03085 [Flavobacteriales bacterium]|nr:hypothetical protein [Flavobacteriales bacterium]